MCLGLRSWVDKFCSSQLVGLRISTVHFHLSPRICSWNEMYLHGHFEGIKISSVISKWPGLGTCAIFKHRIQELGKFVLQKL